MPMLINNTLSVCLILLWQGLLCGEDIGRAAGQDDSVGENFPHFVNSAEARAAYGRLLRDANEQRREALKAHPNDGVALRASWEELRLSLPRAESPSAVLVDPSRGSRFIGFLEGRLRRQPPKWWEDALLSMRAHDAARLSFRRPEPWPYHKAGCEFDAPAGTTLHEDAGELVVEMSKEEIGVLPSEVLQAVKRGANGNLSIHGEANTWFVACHGDASYSFPLFRVDRISGKVIWQTQVWAWGEQRILQGVGWHCVAVVPTRDRVLVFGAANDLVYVEGFRRDNGQVLFRFGSAY
jgi:hypothetical protein